MVGLCGRRALDSQKRRFPARAEYDVPKSKADCLDPRTPKAACTHVIRTEFTGREMVAGRGNPTHSSACMSTDVNACGNVSRIAAEYGGWFQLAYAAFQCHAPGARAVRSRTCNSNSNSNSNISNNNNNNISISISNSRFDASNQLALS